MRDFRSSLFYVREELLLVRTLGFLTFKTFYILKNFHKRKKKIMKKHNVSPLMYLV